MKNVNTQLKSNQPHPHYPETLGKLMLCEISQDPALQSREDMSARKVLEYQHAYSNGIEFPPLLVAKVTDKSGVTWHKLLDGWHRYQALLNNKTPLTQKVSVKILEVDADTTIPALRFLGGRENLKNGLGLTNKDKHALFKAYVRGRFNRRGNTYKSYRDIAGELGFAPHQSIARWMHSYFPAIAKVMGKGNDEAKQSSAEGTGVKVIDMPDLTAKERNIFGATLIDEAKAGDNKTKEAILTWARDLLNELEREAPLEPVSQPEEESTDLF